MRRGGPDLVPLLACCALAPAWGALDADPAAAASPELAVQAGTVSAGDDDARTDWAKLRLSWGDRLLLRAEVPWLRYEGSGIAAAPGFGPVQPVPRERSRRRSGSESGNAGAGTSASTTAPASEGTVIGSETAPERVRTSGVGDVRVGASYRLAGGGTRLFRVDLGASAKLPTADDDRLGTGELDARAGLSGEYRFWSLTLFGGAGYNVFGDPPGVDFTDVFDAYAGVESLPLGERYLVSGWVEGSPAIVRGEGARVAAGLALRTLGKVRFEVQLAAGLTDAAERFSAAVGVSFGLRPPVSGPEGIRR
jgi:hypothetical protein